MKFYLSNEWLWNLSPVHQGLESASLCVCTHVCTCMYALVVPRMSVLVFSEIISIETAEITRSSFRQSGKVIDSLDVRGKDLTVPCAPPFLSHSTAKNTEAQRCSAVSGSSLTVEAGHGARPPAPLGVGRYSHKALPELWPCYVEIRTGKVNEEE